MSLGVALRQLGLTDSPWPPLTIPKPAGGVALTQTRNMKLKIEINLDNAAFEGFANRSLESADILRGLADDIEEGRCLLDAGSQETLLDLNGNAVGKAKVTK